MNEANPSGDFQNAVLQLGHRRSETGVHVVIV